jgi:hypothetical protein
MHDINRQIQGAGGEPDVVTNYTNLEKVETEDMSIARQQIGKHFPTATRKIVVQGDTQTVRWSHKPIFYF